MAIRVREVDGQLVVKVPWWSRLADRYRPCKGWRYPLIRLGVVKRRPIDPVDDVWLIKQRLAAHAAGRPEPIHIFGAEDCDE